MRNEIKRENAAAFVLAVSCVGFTCAVIGVLIVDAAMRWPSAAGCVGTLLAALGIWICAWISGRRFEREHGERQCGAKPESVSQQKGG